MSNARTKVKGTTSADGGYKGHRKGSRKGEVHKVYDTKGPDAAKKAGAKLKLEPSTISTWISTWPAPRKRA